MKKIALLLLLLISLNGEDKYNLGEGSQVASLPLYVGGYFSLEYRDRDNEQRYRVDDLALLAYGSYKKFSYMAEFEYKNLYVKEFTQSGVDVRKDTRIHTERLYADYNYDESYSLRVGKYNSSIGFWNLLPINVLRETTSNPLSTYIIFPKFTTGLDLEYNSYAEGDLRVDVMFQHNRDLDDEYNNYKIDEHYGLNFLYEKEDLSVKANLGYFHNLDNPSQTDSLYYFLLSLKYESEKYQFMGELGQQHSQNSITTEYAGYAQGLYRFTPKHITILRVEALNDKLNATKDELAVFGYTYRPVYPVAIKGEYQFHSLSAQDKFLLSLSVLF